MMQGRMDGMMRGFKRGLKMDSRSVGLLMWPSILNEQHFLEQTESS